MFRLSAAAWLVGLSLLAGAAQAAAPCVATKGAGAGVLIVADVLAPQGVLRGGQVLVAADGKIACVGRDCGARAPGASRIACPGAVLSPGFINDHEHLDFGHIAPVADDGVRFGHRHDWRKGLRGFKGRETFVADKTRDMLSWDELRHLLTGTTSLIGEAMAPGLVRNLDFQAGLEGLDAPRATYAIFPLDDAPGILRDGDCDYGPRAATEESAGALNAYVAHVSEGVDAQARNEFACISSRSFDTTPAGVGGGVSHDLLRSNLAIVHGVALTPEMLAQVAASGSGIVWSPRSNLALYGATLDVRTARKLGIPLALGTDWTPSGSLSMGREAACAAAYSDAHLDGLLKQRDLWRMMTVDAARVAQVDGAVGSIAPGLAADLILVERTSPDAYAAVVKARPQNMMMVMRGGRLMSGAPQIAVAIGGGDCEMADVAGVPRSLCIAAEAGLTYRALSEQMAARGVWPAVFAAAPPVEPTCEVRAR